MKQFFIQKEKISYKLFYGKILQNFVGNLIIPIREKLSKKNDRLYGCLVDDAMSGDRISVNTVEQTVRRFKEYGIVASFRVSD